MTVMSCEFESHFLHEERIFAEIAQLVEHNLAKVRVASSSLVFRSKEKTSEKYIDLFYLSWRECRKRKKVKSINIDIPSSRCFSQIIRNGNIY